MIQVTRVSNGDYWQMQWYVSGVRFRESIGPKATITKKQANIACAKKQAEFKTAPGMASIETHHTIKSWREGFMAIRATHDPKTLSLYGHTFDALVDEFGPDRKLRDVTRMHAAEWAGKIHTRKSRRGKADVCIGLVTAHGYMRRAKAIFQAAVDNDLIPYNPFDRVKVPESPSAEWKYVPVDDVEKMIAEAPDADRRLILALTRYAGLRRGEIERLTTQDIDAGTIRVLARERNGSRVESTKQRFRVVPVSPTLAKHLEQDLPKTPGLILSIKKPTLSSWLDRMAPEYGKPLHTLRKSLETDWTQRFGIADASKMLGNSIPVAMKHYHTVTSEIMDRVRKETQNHHKSDEKTTTSL